MSGTALHPAVRKGHVSDFDAYTIYHAASHRVNFIVALPSEGAQGSGADKSSGTIPYQPELSESGQGNNRKCGVEDLDRQFDGFGGRTATIMLQSVTVRGKAPLSL
jgi:hypothetical protein